MKRINKLSICQLIAIVMAAAILLGLAVPPCQAGYSICVLRDMQDQLATAKAYCSSPGDYTYPTRVLGSTLGSNGNGIDTFFLTDGPGVVAPEDADELGTGFQLLPAATDVYFNFKKFGLEDGVQTNLAYWDGTGEANFAPVSAGYSMEIYETVGPMTYRASVDGSATDVSGFAFTKTCSEGGIHKHPNYCLDGDGFAPVEGFYLFSMEIAMPGMKTTKPYFIVMETDQAPLVLGTAVDWVNNNLGSLTSVPEPSCWILLGSIGVGLAWFGRRKHQA